MVKCEICGGNCDHGELVGGICPECREEERLRQIRASEVAKMLHSPSEQIVLNLEA